MDFNTIQILVLILISLTIIKLFFLIIKRQSFESFLEAYKKSAIKYKWIFFFTYLSFSILCLYLIRTYSDISYTEITATTMFLSFLINAGFMGTSIIENYDLSKINWKMMGIYLFIWFFVMFKAVQEIFNF